MAKKLTPNDRLDAVLMHCPLEELPALLDRAQVIARARGANGTQPKKRVRKAKEPTQEVLSQ